jgi:hypothetical protein
MQKNVSDLNADRAFSAAPTLKDAEYKLVKFLMLDPIQPCHCLNCQIKRVLLELPGLAAAQRSEYESIASIVSSELVMMIPRIDEIIERHTKTQNAKKIDPAFDELPF